MVFGVPTSGGFEILKGPRIILYQRYRTAFKVWVKISQFSANSKPTLNRILSFVWHISEFT